MEEQEISQLKARVLDDTDYVNKWHMVKTTDFHYPNEAKVMESILSLDSDIGYIRSGGYPDAERSIFIIFPNYMDNCNVEEFISAVRISWNSSYYKINHRDILGSILGLGIKREKIGDIVVDRNCCYLFTTPEMADYINKQLQQIGRASVDTEPVSILGINLPKPKVRTIRTTVASPRLDSIVSSCFGLSRTKTVPIISGGYVKVNWEITTKAGLQLDEGDVVSVKGKGRARIREFGGTTKKDRLFVVLEKFI